MSTRPSLQDYVAGKLAPAFHYMCNTIDAHHAIEKARSERTLTPLGGSMFRDAVLGLLAGSTQDALELAAKAEAFLELARSIRETVPRGWYVPGYSEGVRSTELSYLRWLIRGSSCPDLILEATHHFDVCMSDPVPVDATAADYMAPRLLYLEAYELVERVAEYRGIGAELSRKGRPYGVFRQVLRIARAPDADSRAKEKQAFRKRASRLLMTLIEGGHYDNVAYLAHGLAPEIPEPPWSVISQVWDWIADEDLAPVR